MIQVTHNKQGQILIVCDTIEEHGTLTFGVMMALCSGDKFLVSCMIDVISNLPEDQAIKTMEAFPYSKGQLPLKEFFFSLIKEMRNPESPLSATTENKSTSVLNPIIGINQPHM